MAARRGLLRIGVAREHVPVLVWGDKVTPGSLGVRDTFADVGQSLATWFKLPPFPDGKAFL